MIELKSALALKKDWYKWIYILDFTARRLNMKPAERPVHSPFYNFIASSNYGDSKEGFCWADRIQFWARSNDTKFLVYKREDSPLLLFTAEEIREEYENSEYWEGEDYVIPLFPGYFKKLNLNFNEMVQNLVNITAHNKQEKPKMNNFFNKMIDANKDAAVLGAKLTVGKAVNDFLGAKLYKSMPWFTRLFSSKKKATNNAVTKLVAANLVTAAVKIKGGNNEKLNYIAEAMLQDAMVCATRDTEFLNDLIAQVENAASVPDGVLDTFKGETK